jgi:hypothetical protein
VPATVDPATYTVRASVSHLSTWALFTINWDYWLGFIGKVASGNLTDLLGAVGTLTTKCDAKSGAFTVDNGATRGIIKGCVQKVANGTATIGVTNMRAIWFALASTSLPGTPVLEPGDTVTFRAGGTKLAQPLSAIAALSPTTFGYQLTDLVLRVLPGSEVFTKAGAYGKVLKAIVTAEDKAWGGSHLLAKLKANPPDVAGAAEEAFKVLTDASFLTVFAEAAIIAGQKYGVPILTQLTPAILGKVLLAADLVVLIGTLLSWDVQYFLAAYGEVKVTWLVPPAAPTGATVTVDIFANPNTYRATWTEPGTGGKPTGFRLYAGNHLTPGPGCAIDGYPTKAFRQVGGAVRVSSWLGDAVQTDGCLLIVAYNSAGSSPPVIFDGLTPSRVAICTPRGSQQAWCR